MVPDQEHVALTELVFMARGPLPLRVLAVVLAAVGAGILGALLAGAHVALNMATVDVTSLNALQRLLRTGSSAATAWPGWAAAALFLIALVRLRRGPVEPSPGIAAVERLSPTQLRRGLRREYAVVRLFLCLIVLIAALEASRTVATGLDAATSEAASTQLGVVAIETLGYAAAATVLALWARGFAAQLRRLGAT